MSFLNKESIIIDLDGRIENILVLIYAFFYSKIELLAIVCTYGIYDIETAKTNILSTLAEIFSAE